MRELICYCYLYADPKLISGFLNSCFAVRGMSIQFHELCLVLPCPQEFWQFVFEAYSPDVDKSISLLPNRFLLLQFSLVLTFLPFLPIQSLFLPRYLLLQLALVLALLLWLFLTYKPVCIFVSLSSVQSSIWYFPLQPKFSILPSLVRPPLPFWPRGNELSWQHRAAFRQYPWQTKWLRYLR